MTADRKPGPGIGKKAPEDASAGKGVGMMFMKRFFAGVMCLSCLCVVPASFAASEFFLVGGARAVIEGKQLILIGKDSRRSVAPPGRYDTRDGRYSIVVMKNGVVIRDHTRELR